jgi:hypothetical protein
MDDKQRLARFTELQDKLISISRLVNESQLLAVKREELLAQLFNQISNSILAEMKELMPDIYSDHIDADVHEDWDLREDNHDNHNSN